MDDIRHVVASSSTNYVVLGAFEHHVEVWDIVQGNRTASFDTVFDFGGERLAFSDHLDVLVAGAYLRHGLKGYSVPSGEVIWVRKDLKRVQQVSVSSDGQRVFCGREGAPCEVVAVRTGETVERFKGSRVVVESPYEPIRFNDRLTPVVQDLDGNRLFSVARLTFGILAISFAPGRLFISESGGPLRCLSTEYGHEFWRYTPPPGIHVLTMGYRADDDALVGVQWPYEHGGQHRVLNLDGRTGSIGTSYEIDGTDHAIGAQGRRIVTSTRKIVSSADGTVLSQLP